MFLLDSSEQAVRCVWNYTICIRGTSSKQPQPRYADQPFFYSRQINATSPADFARPARLSVTLAYQNAFA